MKTRLQVALLTALAGLLLALPAQAQRCSGAAGGDAWMPAPFQLTFGIPTGAQSCGVKFTTANRLDFTGCDLYLSAGKGLKGAGALVISPGAAGTIDNMSIGVTTPLAAKFTTVSSTNLLYSNAAPTISSGFGTTPSIAANNGTAAFTVNVGTGGTATSGVIGLPTATTGWICSVNNLTAAAAHVAYNTRQTASSTTSATLENQTTSTGAAVAWAASSILNCSCFAY